MNAIIIYTVITLSLIGLISAVILYFVAQKFKVEEDPRIEQVLALLPGANCGGCGFPGCQGMADALVKASDISDLNCPVSDKEIMKQIGVLLGHEVTQQEPKIAVVRCNGSCENRPKTNHYDGARSCAFASSLYSGDTGCSYGCLGHGDCVAVCKFDAIYIDPITNLPVVDQEKCVACGACVKACPKGIIELRNKGKKDRRIYVSCINKDRGAVAKKACNVACIGCSKCQKVCAFDAITIENNLAYIDYNKCKLCRKCVTECPTNSIIEVNFPPKAAATAVADAQPQQSNE
jgi:Na+-translocating ferredoxin:NAD+ oxidoreductase RNF subunit RnfB